MQLPHVGMRSLIKRARTLFPKAIGLTIQHVILHEPIPMIGAIHLIAVRGSLVPQTPHRAWRLGSRYETMSGA
jgi:hypothetical protein